MSSENAHLRLGAVMIVKNEEKNIGNILGDIKEIMDEIVVVDTGSTDSTLDILKGYGVTIGHYTWNNDFSAARNASIDLASCDYLIWFDADDRLDEVSRDALVQLKRSLPQEKNQAYMLKILSSSLDQSDTISYQLRIFPNLEQVRFSGRLHEQILPSIENIPGMQVISRDVTIRHTGYHLEEDIIAKGRRNLAIQLKEIEEGKDTAKQNFYVALSYFAVKDYAKCLEYILKARSMSRKENWYKYSFNIAMESLLHLGRIDQALEEAKKGVECFPASGTMHYSAGAVCLKAQKYDMALESLDKAARLGIEVDVFPSPPNIDSILPYYRGIAVENLGRENEAADEYSKSLKNNPNFGPAHKALGLILIRKGDMDNALIHMEKAKDYSRQFDPGVWLSLAKLYLFKKRFQDAHGLYKEASEHIPSNRDILAGLIHTSIAIDDIDCLLQVLDAFMQSFSMDTDREISSIQELAGLCAEVAGRLLEENDIPTGDRLLDAALLLDTQCSLAHLLKSDLDYAQGEMPKALAHLEKALRSGGDPKVIEERMKRFEQRDL